MLSERLVRALQGRQARPRDRRPELHGFADLLERGEFLARITDQDRVIVGSCATREGRRDATAERLASSSAASRRSPSGPGAPQRDRGGQAGAHRHAGRLRRHAGRQAARAVARSATERTSSKDDLESIEKEQAKIQARCRHPRPASLPGRLRSRAGGRFIWPVNGPITGAVRRAAPGPHARRHRHRGARSGTPIRAADAGRSSCWGGPAATATTPASSTPRRCPRATRTSRAYGTSVGRERHQGPGHRLRRQHRPLVRRAPALRGARQRRARTHAVRTTSSRSTSLRAVQPEIDILGLPLKTFGLCSRWRSSRPARSSRGGCASTGEPADWAYEMIFAGARRRPGRLARLLHRPELGRRQGRPARQLFSGSGLVWYGGAIGGAIGVLPVGLAARHAQRRRCWTSARSRWRSGYAIGRVGCQISGDGDYGKPWDCRGRWPTRTGPCRPPSKVHPTPIYETLAMGTARATCSGSCATASRPGVLFALYLVVAGVERLLVEFLRRNDRSSPG